MTKQYINPPELFPSQQYGFSQVVTSPPGKMVFISGQVAWNAAQEIMGEGDLKEQALQALRNVAIAVQTAGGSLRDVVSMRIYVVERASEQSGAVREALLEFFPWEEKPATTWIVVTGLANEDFLIEIEPIAVIS